MLQARLLFVLVFWPSAWSHMMMSGKNHTTPYTLMFWATVDTWWYNMATSHLLYGSETLLQGQKNSQHIGLFKKNKIGIKVFKRQKPHTLRYTFILFWEIELNNFLVLGRKVNVSERKDLISINNGLKQTNRQTVCLDLLKSAFRIK